MAKISIRCRHCGSADVVRDASAEWDDTQQDWVLASVFDAAYCNLCEADTSLDEVPLDAPPAAAPVDA